MNFDRGSSGQIGEQWYVLAAFDRSRLSLDGTSKRESLEIDRMQECSDAIHAPSSGQDIFVTAGEDTKTVKAMKAMKMTKTVTKAGVPRPKAVRSNSSKTGSFRFACVFPHLSVASRRRQS